MTPHPSAPDPTDAMLAQIEARLNAATPGDWSAALRDDDENIVITTKARMKNNKVDIAEVSAGYDGPIEDEQQANAALIANAPTDLRTLLSLVRTLKASNAEMVEAVAAEREACAKVAEDWLQSFDRVRPVHIDAKTWADDAVKDIADAIRARAALATAKPTQTEE